MIDHRLYATLTDAEIEVAIQALRDEKSKRRGYEPAFQPQQLHEMLDINGPNFMGTGLSLPELLASGRLQAFMNSLGEQSRDERHRRLKYLVLLGAELAKIRETETFATGLAEMAIEDLIKGDWAGVRSLADGFRFTDEHPSISSRYAPLYARFAELLDEAFATRSGTEPQPTVMH
jgi:hypothetical protein